MQTAFSVICPSRLHLSLIGMGHAGYRVNGGIGFALNAPSLDIQFSISSEPGIDIQDVREFPFETIQIQQLQALLGGFISNNKIAQGVRIHVGGSTPTHGGFGSSTAIRLACLEGMSHLFNLEASREELVVASGRGGTSGIGINTYFDGGFVFDVGHAAEGSDFAPSHSRTGHDPSLALIQMPMPQWEIGVCIPRQIPLKTQLEEQHFFRSHCPLPACDIHEILYHSVYGITASVKERDFGRFCGAVRALQRTAWKKGERTLYGERLQQVEDAIYDAGALAVGMSSLGPGLFFLGDDVPTKIEALRKQLPTCEWLSTSVRNSGREVEDG
ncbi:hypothetical protein PDESU_00804 [Pontiella desulfatans]|uniref:GHMP kinase N-terminal domain-containing protein n=1 Tax=Pontiella desulfatans TaxID=2750659 RepID=A0A6C2TXC1_PONDE|nr:beta-ribofuranosylaminobenzene 5'-phosphate synthase family protein [Pontiella desulfatans]VGO12253.1 hypothetical protein PDESU_00804 [Pontiella desulfatans]